MAKGHYYTPVARIALVPGVQKIQSDCRADRYAGNAEALQQSGLLRPDMLPQIGRYSITWRPEGGERLGGQSWFWVPGYIEIRRHLDGSFRVALAVSREEQERRKAQAEEEQKARNQKWERDRAETDIARAASAEQLQAIHSPATAAKFRDDALHEMRFVRCLLSRRLRVSDVCAWRYDLDEEEAEDFEDALQSIEDVLSRASIVVDRVKAAQFDVLRKHSSAKQDKPLQQFLTTVAGKVRRGSAGVGKK